MNTEQMTAGRLVYFEENLQDLLNYANTLIRADEIEKAEWLLSEGMPGYYRDHPPRQVVELREKLYKFLMNVADYANAPDDIRMVSMESGIRGVTHFLRGQLIRDSIQKYNQEGKTPHVFEMGPGEFWLPIGLKSLGLKFTYQSSFLSTKAYEKAKQHLEGFLVDRPEPNQPKIFVACEIIEHLREEKEIVHCAYKHGMRDADEIHVSTPLYTYAEGARNWESEDMKGLGGHLRTYGPAEFSTIVSGMFPGYSWQYYPDTVQSIVGRKAN